jgi:hypothetical protein
MKAKGSEQVVELALPFNAAWRAKIGARACFSQGGCIAFAAVKTALAALGLWQFCQYLGGG